MINLREAVKYYFADFVRKGRGQKKILVFFDFRSKGGGGLGQSKKSLSENTQIFFDQGGGVSPNPKGFYQKN